jgi:transcriptional regulator with XRE-family HTH domain
MEGDMFADKLNFLMSIIGISGGELAHAVSIDPSYISRLRSGKRALPKGQHFLDDIARYFATHIHTDYQINLLCEAMNFSDVWPKDTEKAHEYINDWLLLEEGAQRDKIRNVLEGMVSTYLVDAVLSPDCDLDLTQFEQDIREHYYGSRGKQEAFLRFLTLALHVQDGKEMYMFTNENMDWLSADPDFAGKTKALLTSYAKAGNRIKIVHPIRQDINDMMFTLQRWIPVYLTGYVEPYYYSKARNDIYLRTAFVVPGVSAMISCSLDGNPAEGVTFIVTEPRAVAAVAAEMIYLISLSKPLAQVYSAKYQKDIQPVLSAFFTTPASTMVIHDHLTPFVAIEECLKEKDCGDGVMLDRSFAESLIRKNSYIEVISKPDIEVIRSGNVPIQLTELLPDGPKHLSKESYQENLDYVIRKLEESDNYHVAIVPHIFFNLYLCVKQGVGVLISRAEKGAPTFFICQRDMVDAVWEYVTTIKDQATAGRKEAVLTELKELAKALQA